MNTTNFTMKESVFDIFATMNSQINYKEDCYYENNQKILSIVAVAGVLLGSTMTVFAERQPIITSQIWVSGGGSNFASQTSIKKESERKCYIRLVSFKLNYYPDNTIPSSKYIYARVYVDNKSTKASECAGFNGRSSAGNYNYKYLREDLGGVNRTFYLKTNSSSNNGYWAKFDWKADKY